MMMMIIGDQALQHKSVILYDHGYSSSRHSSDKVRYTTPTTGREV